MPTYDYRCRTCDTRVEVRRSVSEQESAVTCPACAGATSRVWTAVSVGGSGSAQAAPVPAGGGGCCGGGCCG